MPSLQVLPVVVRRLLARRPWIYWLVVLLLTLAIAAAFRQHVAAIDAARRGWGETQAVLVARHDVRGGETIEVDVRDVPLTIVPTAALATGAAGTALVARQDVSAGEIVTSTDVGRRGHDSVSALLPDGWAALPIVESPPLGASIGARVQIASGGIVLAPDAIVVGYHDDVTVIAMPADVAPMVGAAAEADGLSVLLLP